MRPALRPGDYVLLDPTARRWPRRGSVVVFQEPGTDVLAVKRVAARPGDVVRLPTALLEGVASVPGLDPSDGAVAFRLGADEAWLLGDVAEVSVDSRRYGPVSLDRFVARAWFRYWPPRRVGIVGRERP